MRTSTAWQRSSTSGASPANLDTSAVPTPNLNDHPAGSDSRTFRVDAQHVFPQTAKSPPVSVASPAFPTTASIASIDAESPVSPQQTLFDNHTFDLMHRLQSWAESLDAREARLNARTALLEQAERQLRLDRQRWELHCAQEQAKVEQEIQGLRAAARRLAFE